jgi:hypothetical protein
VRYASETWDSLNWSFNNKNISIDKICRKN